MSAQWGNAKWIWDDRCDFTRSRFVAFRRSFEYSGGEVELQITADARYIVWLNGRYVQCGPARSYPEHYSYDKFSLQSYVRKGKNSLVVLVKHFGVSTFHYVLRQGGLLFRLRTADAEIVSDETCLCRECPEYAAHTPKISCQQEYEEQIDARVYDGWREPAYDDGAWPRAAVLRNAEDGIHRDMTAREIPFLTREERYPKRALSVFAVRKIRYVSFDIVSLLQRGQFSDTPYLLRCGFLIELYSERAQNAEIVYREMFRNLKLNGAPVSNSLALRAGKNVLTFYEQGVRHATQATLSFYAEHETKVLSIKCVGPFSPGEEKSDIGYYQKIEGPGAGAELSEIMDDFAAGKETFAEFAHDFTFFLHKTNVFAENYRAEGAPLLETPDLSALCGAGYDLDCDGRDKTILLDFKKELIGFLSFEVQAAAGTALDFHFFEFIQPDGRKNFAEGMNDTMRYICREGVQRYESHIRRGGRYLFLTVRGGKGRVKIGALKLLFSTYPQSGRGEFFSSDYLLNHIYSCSRDTLRCCMEDTYTDCPTYEQTFWVGDMRNEALVDWVLNGDARLWKRCLILAGQSLDHSDIVLSQVPSGWWNVLPAWTMLWMLTAAEYQFYTADDAGMKQIFPLLKRNLEGLKSHILENGLLKIYGWNMFDWAPMDTPVDGIVAHVNFLACLALRENARLAKECGEAEYAADCEKMYRRISAALNEHLWDEERRAYADCLALKGGTWAKSRIFSQQTQTVALLSGVAAGAKRDACLAHVLHPQDLVTSGSPFFSFFLLELLRDEGLEEQLFAALRENWGMMTDTGCNTFWEQWGYPSEDGRVTRSHCHGWSACPAYFLAEYVLGVRPTRAGYAQIKISPHTGGLRFARGTIPTPHGDIEMRWEMREGKFFAHCRIPAAVEAVVDEKLSNGEVIVETY